MMLRGEIRWVDLEPVQGSEANKRRPCVIVSNNNANRAAELRGRGVLSVLPITSNTTTVYPFQVLLPANKTGLNMDSKAQAEQIRSVDVRRIGGLAGRVPLELMVEIDAAVRLHLGM